MPVCTLELPAEPLLSSPPPPQPPPTATDAKPPPIIHPSVGADASAASPILLQQSPPSPASLSGPPSPDPRDDCSSCPHCQEEYGGARPVYWRIQLDRDLLETILSIYPEWFKDCNLDLLNMADSSGNSSASSGSGGSAEGGSGTPNSPPKAEVDDSPLQKCMDKNKECIGTPPTRSRWFRHSHDVPFIRPAAMVKFTNYFYRHEPPLIYPPHDVSALKVKLMLRRPINQLVAQGIMPPLKTPPAFHEQRQKLERAKTGDLLKAKIQQRPDRQELVRQHILEDVGHVDPSLAERQRMLKKARLQDSLNDQLSHRPGPLELIKKNILHTDETIERAVKEGQIPFRATCEGQLTKPQHPSRYITLEEDSSSEGGQSPPQQQLQAPPQGLTPTTQSTLVQTAQGQTLLLPAGMCFEVPVSVVQCPPAPSPSMTSSLSSLSPISSVASPQSTTAPSPALVATPIITLPAPTVPPPPPPPPPLPPVVSQPQQQPTTITIASPIQVSLPTAPVSISTALTAPTTAALMSTQRPMSRAEKEQQKNRKKSKTKTQPKARTIKFHEYKGPPNASKSNNSPLPVETSYELLLQQQQLFLQWQLEWQHKYPQIILPAAQKPPANSDITTATLSNLITVSAAPSPQIISHSQSSNSSQPPSIINVPSPASSLASPAPPATPSLPPPTPESIRAVSKLEDMKVNDLKAELKKRNLPVSGSKPQLIERLRPFSEQMGLMSCYDQPATPSSVSSNHGASDPKSVGTLALGEDSLSGLSSMDTPGSPLGGDTSFLGLEQCLSPDNNSNSNHSGTNTSQPASPLSLGPMSHAPSSLMSPATHMDVDLDLDLGGNMDTSAAPDTPGSPALVQVPSPVSPPSPPVAKPQQQQQQQVLLPLVNEDIITQQQRRIEQLQRELQKSQQQLQKIKNKETAAASSSPNGQAQPDNSTKNQLQQHLQHKMQQQKLQAQLQQLQALQTLHQQQQQQHQQQVAKQAAATQPQPQVPAVAVGQQGTNVKASLAAFLQAQQISAGQAQQPLLLSITTTAPAQQPNLNNNNSIPNNNNNETAVINNKNKSQMQKGQQQKMALNQINLLQKQRSNTLTQAPNNPAVQNQRTASLPNFFGSFVQQNASQQPQVIQITPQQQAKLASPKSETQFVITNKPPPPLYEEATKFLKVQINKDAKQKHIKSQIVEDVLEILIKNGELPPSAAQVPVTPTTPGQSTPHGLVFKPAQQDAAKASPPTPPPLPQEVADQDSSFTLNLQSMLEDSISAMTLPDSKASTPEETDGTFAMSQLDMILGQTGNNPLPINVASGNIMHQELSTNPTVDLKDLGLDLETMDFGQLEPIKLEGADLLAEDKCGDSSIHHNEEEPMEGVVSAGEMPMDLDMSDWLESLLPSASSPSLPEALRPPQQQVSSLVSHQGVNIFSGSSGSDLDTYDPLLSNSQDVFDLFNMEDTDMKMSTSDMNTLNWDKVDYAA